MGRKKTKKKKVLKRENARLQAKERKFDAWKECIITEAERQRAEYTNMERGMNAALLCVLEEAGGTTEVSKKAFYEALKSGEKVYIKLDKEKITVSTEAAAVEEEKRKENEDDRKDGGI